MTQRRCEGAAAGERARAAIHTFKLARTWHYVTRYVSEGETFQFSLLCPVITQILLGALEIN